MATVALILGLLAIVFGITSLALLNRAHHRRPQPPALVMSLVHDCGGEWGKWGDPVEHQRRNGYGEILNSHWTQDRRCSECGAVERVRIEEGKRQ